MTSVNARVAPGEKPPPSLELLPPSPRLRVVSPLVPVDGGYLRSTRLVLRLARLSGCSPALLVARIRAGLVRSPQESPVGPRGERVVVVVLIEHDGFGADAAAPAARALYASYFHLGESR